MVSAESGRTFDESDVEFAEQIAGGAGRGERAPVHRALGGRSHASAQPAARSAPRDSRLGDRRALSPAGRGTEVGGDFYDFWEVEGDWLMMIGDVTGKGVGAAAVTSLVAAHRPGGV